MPTAEERIAYLEGQVNEHSHGFVELRESMRHLERRMESGFEAINGRMDRLEHRVSQNFTWLVGLQVTTLIAAVGALLARG